MDIGKIEIETASEDLGSLDASPATGEDGEQWEWLREAVAIAATDAVVSGMLAELANEIGESCFSGDGVGLAKVAAAIVTSPAAAGLVDRLWQIVRSRELPPAGPARPGLRLLN